MTRAEVRYDRSVAEEGDATTIQGGVAGMASRAETADQLQAEWNGSAAVLQGAVRGARDRGTYADAAEAQYTWACDKLDAAVRGTQQRRLVNLEQLQVHGVVRYLLRQPSAKHAHVLALRTQ